MTLTSIFVLIYKRMYNCIPDSKKIYWDNNVVEPIRVLLTIGLLTYSFVLGLLMVIVILLAPLFIRSYYAYAPIVSYLLWVLYDWRTPFNGIGRPSERFRNSFPFKLGRRYFSGRIIKLGTSQNLDPKENYIVGYHPHGNAPIGYFAGFGTEGANYKKLFPNHDRHLFAHPLMFIIPVIREFEIAWGAHSIDRSVMDKVMNRYANKPLNGTHDNSNNDGKERERRKSLFVIVPGGIDEMLKTRPGVLDLTLKNRKGFVRQAIRHGAHLVPSICFGETELWGIYRPAENSILFKIQSFARNYFNGFTLNYPIGVGLTPNSWGVLPARKPLTVVMGNIIPVDMDPEPCETIVDRVHQQYIQEIERLFEEAKDQYGPPGYKLMIH